VFHVALLRGINVGGKNIIPMAALSRCFVDMKYSSVKTFIASGNVIFEAPKQDLRKLEEKIEKVLQLEFNYDARVVVKSKAEYDAIVKSARTTWKKPTSAYRYYVVFLRHAINNRRILDQLPVRAGVETLAYAPGALLWATKAGMGTKSTVARKLLVKALYQEVTIRNLNTTLKLGALISE
jgi:uncharacterized protein (DUF1697 family)